MDGGIFCVICLGDEGKKILSRILGGGILLKREGWLIAVYFKDDERFPRVSIRRDLKSHMCRSVSSEKDLLDL